MEGKKGGGVDTWRTEDAKEEGLKCGDGFKSGDGLARAKRFITPTLRTLPSLCFPVNVRQIRAREHPYTSIRPLAAQPPPPPLSISGLIPQLMNFNRPQSETPQQCFSISQSNGLEPPESS